ncbi:MULTISPECIES: hypothetical protein [unclassified Burkholderia]|uniref:hypothetical protein n=1 Tax=unclassified Burkholderia TaxID=2613784 RepID=UPI002AB24E6E|nr:MULTISPECIES: hypothetical protein [unclassified Burkholderia]
MKAGARDRCADMPPGFCLKNIGTKLAKKIPPSMPAAMPRRATGCAIARNGRNEWA